MRISRRTSGGRGEYEISEASPEGLTPSDILQKHIQLDFGAGWVVDTGSTLTSQGGKRRIRLSYGTQIHPHRQVATALMMPRPVRADPALGGGLPILKSNCYAIEHIELTSVGLLAGDVARLTIGEVILRNLSYHAELLNYAERLQKLQAVWNRAGELPETLAALVHRHRTLVTSGGAIGEEAEKLVDDIQAIITQLANELGIMYRSTSEDALRDLVLALRIAEVPPEPPIPIEQIEPEEVEIRRRTVKEWKRWANSRGAASARFREQVRKAYNSTCVVCGLHFPATDFAGAGVEAAHILPWAEYDLDHVSNGVCFCRNHHWAFDEDLIEIYHHEGDYYVMVPEEVIDDISGKIPQFSLQELIKYVGKIDAKRLPNNPNQKPNPKFLELLRKNS